MSRTSLTFARPWSPRAATAWYRRVWRWHFYAGILTLPFVIVLAITGTIYLFKPQIDAWAERRFDHLALTAAPEPLDAQVAAARQALPTARLVGVEWRADRSDAGRVLMMGADGEQLRVYVRPDTLAILKVVPEGHRLTKIVRTIHGELLAGEAGAIFVELVGAWAIVMVITGLYLWWPSGARGLGGVLYPRWGGGGRRFLRDLHAVVGIWISVAALFFLISALPWTKVWGGGLKAIEATLGHDAGARDWTTGPASEHAEHMHAYSQAKPALLEGPDARVGGSATTVTFDAVAAAIAGMGLADPVIIAPPTRRQPNWIIRSDAQNRPLRVTLQMDPMTQQIVHRQSFGDGSLIDRIVGIGVAAHEGQLFGWVNQALGVFTALGVLTMAVSGALMWWTRRPQRRLGAPAIPSDPPRMAPLIGATIVVLGCLLPTLGISLVGVLLVERLVLRRIAPVNTWLGLARP